MDNTIVNEIAKSVSKEIAKSISIKDIVNFAMGENGLVPVIGKDFWIANYKVSLKIK